MTEAFTRIALAYPAVHFTLRHHDRSLFDLPPADRWRDRIAAFFGSELGDALISVDSRDGEVRLSGYAADPSCSRTNNRMQYLFLNGRHIRDRALQHALGEAYRGLLLTGRFPVAFLRLELPADAVDVNVHPTKLEVRFQDGNRLYSQLLSALRQKFLNTDLTARVQSTPPPADATPAAAHDQEQATRHREELVRWAQGALQPPATAPWEGETAGTAVGQPAGPPVPLVPPDRESPPAARPQQASLNLRFDPAGGSAPRSGPSRISARGLPRRRRRSTRMHRLRRTRRPSAWSAPPPATPGCRSTTGT